MQQFTDPASGRPYTIDPVTGESRWVDAASPFVPEVSSSQLMPAIPPAATFPGTVVSGTNPAYGYPVPNGAAQSGMAIAKSPTGPCVLSFVGGLFGFPGIGSFLAGSPGTAIGMLVAGWFCLLLCLVFIGFILYPLVWIGSVAVAYFDVQRWNRRYGFVT